VVEGSGSASSDQGCPYREPLRPISAPPATRSGAAAPGLFELIANGALEIKIGQIFPFLEAADAHRAIEGRRTTGSAVLIPKAARLDRPPEEGHIPIGRPYRCSVQAPLAEAVDYMESLETGDER
jgi:hypothetical protein